MFLPAAARLNRLRNFEVLEDRRLLTSHFGADVPGPLPSQSGPGQPLSVRVDAESSAASTFSVPIIEELTGNRLYQVQGAAQLESSQLIAVDISRTYAITGRFRTLDFGTAAVSLGFVAFDENQQSLGFRAAAASAEVVDGQWSMFVSDMVEGTGGQPHQFPAGTTHIRLAVNISPQTDQVTMQLDDVAIREVVELTTCNAGVNPVGDGVTNDAPALQTCIDGLSDGSTIYVPKDHEFRSDFRRQSREFSRSGCRHQRL